MRFSLPRTPTFYTRALATLIVIVWIYVLVRYGKSQDTLAIENLQPVHIGSTVSYADNTHMYFKGFSAPEPGYRWSARPDAALIFKLSDPLTRGFDICFQGILAKGVTMTARINGVMPSIRVDRADSRICMEAATSASSNGLVRVDLHFSGFSRRSGDSRSLGLHLTSISLRQVQRMMFLPK